MKNQKLGAMEMSVGTIVTIVLLMAVLVLGIMLTQQIFSSAKGAIDLTDKQLTDEINKLYSNEADKIILYPKTGEIEIKKGDSDEFAFVINNKENEEKVFSYEVNVESIGNNCNINERDAENFIQLGSSGSGIRIPSGDISIPKRVRITIPDSTPLCDGGIRYSVTVEERSGEVYAQTDIDVIIKQ